jgi:hypothetical protein
MTDFLSSVKDDLLDRRRLPYLLALSLALVGALAYAALGAGGSPSASPVAAPGSATAVPGASGISITPAPSGSQALAETTSGSSEQHVGLARDPFTPLAGASTTSAPATTSSSAPTAASTTSSQSGSTSTQSGSSSPETKGEAPATKGEAPASAPKPSPKPKTPTQSYDVAVLFGVTSASTPSSSSQLTSYEDLERGRQLPNSKEPLVSLSSVAATGASATFTLAGEAILHGDGTCLPSSLQCQSIELKPGQSEQLEYLPPSGQSVTYELRVVSIVTSIAKAARAHAASRPHHTRRPTQHS